MQLAHQGPSLSELGNLDAPGNGAQPRLSIHKAILSSVPGWHFWCSDYKPRNIWFVIHFSSLIKGVWSFGAGKYLDPGTYPGSLGPYYFPLRLPLPFPMDDTKQSQSLFENRGAANHQLHYIQNLFMLGVLLQTFTIRVVKDCCRQKNFSCQKTFYRIS